MEPMRFRTLAKRLRSPLPILVPLAIVISLMLAGCLTSTQGGVAVYLRADPHEEFTEITMTFTRVEVHRAGADIGDGPEREAERGAGEDAPPAERGIVTLTTDSVEVDLLQFQDVDSRALLAVDEAGQGQYDEIVIRLGEAHGILREDGSEVEFNVRSPEMRESQEFLVTADQTTRLILELDLEASVSQTEEGEWRLSPNVTNIRSEENAEGSEEDVPDRGV